LLERLQRPVNGVRIVRKFPQPLDPEGISAQLIPFRRVSKDDVLTALAQVQDLPGRVVTSALGSNERQPFLEAGFTHRESLYLLNHALDYIPPVKRHQHRLRTGRWTDTDAVLDIDRRSFDDFWILDRDGLQAAKKATPVHRYRVATINREVVGYSITGRAGRTSFLQRLGVDPKTRGEGIGTDLVRDGLRWALGQGAASMLVNTQVSNEGARRLYESIGFELSNDRLDVLEWTTE